MITRSYFLYNRINIFLLFDANWNCKQIPVAVIMTLKFIPIKTTEVIVKSFSNNNKGLPQSNQYGCKNQLKVSTSTSKYKPYEKKIVIETNL